MFRHHQQSPMDRRVNARRPISTDLLAAAASTPHALADVFRTAWFEAADQVVERGQVIVFDEFVVGRPDPFLLEVAHRVRMTRRAEYIGVFDDEEEQWYDDHADDDDAVYESPTIPERVLRALANGQEAERLAPGSVMAQMVNRALRPERSSFVELLRLGLTIERLAVELADAICIGDAAVIDARLAGARADGWRWAA